MKCTNCGNELEENAVKCEVCGTEVQPQKEEQGQEGMPEQEGVPEQEPGQEGVSEPGPEGVPEQEAAAGQAAADNVENIPGKNQGKGSAMLKKHWLKLVLAIAVIVLIVYAAKYYQVKEELARANTKYSDLTEEYNSVRSENTALNETIDTLEAENDELKNGAATQLVTIRNTFEAQDWNKVIELAKELHEKYNGSAEDKEAQELAKQSQSKIDEAKAAEEAKKAKGYETGITYDQLTRTPDDFKSELVKFSGSVVQVIEGDYATSIRLAINDNHNTIIYGYYSPGIVPVRILEGDHITIYGRFQGMETYETVLGKPVSLPEISIDKIEQ